MLYQQSPDVFCIAEHWCVKDCVQELVIGNQYKLASNFSRQNYIHGGTAIFVKNGIDVKNLYFLNDFCLELDFECCGIEMRVGQSKTCIICVYRSNNNKCNIENFINRLYIVISKCMKYYQKMVVCGDFNLNFYKKADKKSIMDLLQCYQLININEEYTRIFTNINNVTSKSKLDYIITDFPAECCTFSVYDFSFGDHYAIKLNIILSEKLINGKNESGNKIAYRRITEDSISQLNNYLPVAARADLGRWCQNFKYQ